MQSLHSAQETILGSTLAKLEANSRNQLIVMANPSSYLDDALLLPVGLVPTASYPMQDRFATWFIRNGLALREPLVEP